MDRYREPIWTACFQSVVLPWITPSEGRQAAADRMGGALDAINDSFMGQAMRRTRSVGPGCFEIAPGCGEPNPVIGLRRLAGGDGFHGGEDDGWCVGHPLVAFPLRPLRRFRLSLASGSRPNPGLARAFTRETGALNLTRPHKRAISLVHFKSDMGNAPSVPFCFVSLVRVHLA